MRDVANGIETQLAALGTDARAEGEKRYLKSDLHFLGTTLPDTRAVVKKVLRDDPDMSRDALVDLVDKLWAKDVFERKMAATILLEENVRLLQARDMKLLERLLRESETWALVDPLATKVAGGLVQRYASLNKTLDRWAKDDDFWIRRSAMLALLLPLRRGDGDFERFAIYADRMLEEKEFFIRKAIGWILRETSKKQPELVFEWLKPRAHRASGVTMREAVRYLSEQQAAALAKSRNHQARKK